MAYGRYCGTNAATIIHTVPYTGRGKIKYICRMATPSTIPGNTRGSMVKRSSIQRREMPVRATIHATTNATANQRRWRDRARELIPDFHEIYVKCGLELCREREKDRKDVFAPPGVYKKAIEGWPVPGVNVPYEEPLNPELVIECDRLGADEAAERLIKYIRSLA